MDFEVWSVNKLGIIAARAIKQYGANVRIVLWKKNHVSDNPCNDDLIYASDEGIEIKHISGVYNGPTYSQVKAVFVCGWPRLIPPNIEGADFTMGFHPTMLPRGRGRAPIPHTILHDLALSGVTLFRLTSGVDNGPILQQVTFEVGYRPTAMIVYDKVCISLNEVIKKWLEQNTNSEGIPQDERLASYWPKRIHRDGLIDPYMRVEMVDRLIRALDGPYPHAFAIVEHKTNNYSSVELVKAESIKHDKKNSQPILIPKERGKKDIPASLLMVDGTIEVYASVKDDSFEMFPGKQLKLI